jgi:homopolymeric O-antigen transport system permease protein
MNSQKRMELVIDGAPARRLGSALAEVWVFRGTIRAFAERDIRVKYKQTALGVGWAVIQPLAFIAIFTLTIGRVAEVSEGDVPYAAFSLSALVPWTFVSTGVSFGASGILMDAAMVRRVYFPREVPVLAAVAGASVDFGIGLVLFTGLGPFLGANVSWWWLLTPVLFFFLATLASAVAIPLAAMNVYYRDFRFAIPFAVQLWLFASPVAYPLSVVPPEWQPLYVALNPAAGLLDSFSSVLAAGTAPNWTYLGVSLLGTLVIGLLGYLLFKRLEPNFADVI